MADEGLSLKSFNIETGYDAEDHFEEDPRFILNKFYKPCLSNSIHYDRLAGFFSSSVFTVISESLMQFVLNGGVMRLIASPYISSKDRDAILGAEERKSEIINKVLLDEIFSENGELSEPSELLGWMVANKKLEIRIAVMYSQDGRLLSSDEIDKFRLFHHKIGIFEDPNGAKVSFSGSINETLAAWVRNGESFNAFCDWKIGQSEYVQGHQKRFTLYWEPGKHSTTYVTSLPEAVEHEWVKDIPKSIEDLRAYKTYLKEKEQDTTSAVPGVEERQYQKDAVETWVKQGYRGLFDMATGTGKTKTSLLAAKRIISDKKNQVAVVIVCPYLHLAQMWEEEIVEFGFKNYVMGHSQSPNWRDDFERKVRLFSGKPETFIFITTVNTFCTEYVQKWINKISSRTLLIVDEVHRMGSAKYSKYLNESIPYRLGVSATIDRFKDPTGTNKLIHYFGERCITYTLEMALKDGKLTPYKYHPLICYFTDDEYNRIIDINKEIDALLELNSAKNLKKIDELKVNGSKLMAKMDNKIETLVNVMKTYQNEYHMLIYCGATSVTSLNTDIDAETGNSEESERLITHISKILKDKYDLNLRTFTCADNLENRKIIIEDFVKKHIQSILAIRCLDEGVNIPDIRYAFLLSSSEDPKEYIQRRGRVLRLAKDKPYAEIFDFLAFPKSYESGTYSLINKKIEFSIILKELKRVYEFSRLSMNPEESKEIINKVSKIYQIENIGEELNGQRD